MLRSLRILLSIMHDTNDNGFLCYIIQNFPLRKFSPVYSNHSFPLSRNNDSVFFFLFLHSLLSLLQKLSVKNSRIKFQDRFSKGIEIFSDNVIFRIV